MKRILSGMRSTGKLHLGHYFGVLDNWRVFQDNPDYECYFMVADWHAFSSEYKNPGVIGASIMEVAADWLASGIDPEKAVIFVQGAVPAHTELALLFSMIVPLPWLERNPTYKDLLVELEKKDILTHGFLGYPVLQAADILLYLADAVPIGADQLPHLELTREIARRFNSLYGQFFPEPEAILTPTPKVPGTDNRKMSKSYNNCLYLADSPAELKPKVLQMVTDPARARRHDPGHPEICAVFAFQNIVNAAAVPEIETACKTAAIGCFDCKQRLLDKLIEYLAPIYEKRVYWREHPQKIREILHAGQEKAQEIAVKNLAQAKKLAGLDWK